MPQCSQRYPPNCVLAMSSSNSDVWVTSCSDDLEKWVGGVKSVRDRMGRISHRAMNMDDLFDNVSSPTYRGESVDLHIFIVIHGLLQMILPAIRNSTTNNLCDERNNSTYTQSAVSTKK